MQETKNNSKDIKSKLIRFLPNLKEEKIKRYTTLILTLISLSFFGLFAIGPTLSTITELNKELDDSRFVDQKLGQKISNLTVLQQKYAALQPDLPTILRSIPKDPQVPSFAADVQAVTVSSNVSLQSFQTFEVEINKLPNPRKYSSYSFALIAEGNYNDLSNFLSNLSTMQRITSIDTISLTKKTGTTNLLQLTIKGKTFFSQ